MEAPRIVERMANDKLWAPDLAISVAQFTPRWSGAILRLPTRDQGKNNETSYFRRQSQRAHGQDQGSTRDHLFSKDENSVAELLVMT